MCAELQATVHVNPAPLRRLTLWSTVDCLLDTLTHSTALTSLSYRFAGVQQLRFLRTTSGLQRSHNDRLVLSTQPLSTKPMMKGSVYLHGTEPTARELNPLVG